MYYHFLATLILLVSGTATRYNPGVMERVVHNRIEWGHIEDDGLHLGYVAVEDCAYLGEKVVLLLPSGVYHGPYLVADCASSVDSDYLHSIGFAVDLSYRVAVDLGVINAPLHGVSVFLYGEKEGRGISLR